jgi:hypothetical protein
VAIKLFSRDFKSSLTLSSAYDRRGGGGGAAAPAQHMIGEEEEEVLPLQAVSLQTFQMFVGALPERSGQLFVEVAASMLFSLFGLLLYPGGPLLLRVDNVTVPDIFFPPVKPIIIPETTTTTTTTTTINDTAREEQVTFYFMFEFSFFKLPPVLLADGNFTDYNCQQFRSRQF